MSSSVFLYVLGRELHSNLTSKNIELEILNLKSPHKAKIGKNYFSVSLLNSVITEVHMTMEITVMKELIINNKFLFLGKTRFQADFLKF